MDRLRQQEQALMKSQAQIDYWNGAAGAKWVAQADRLDQMLAPFSDALIIEAAPKSEDRILDVGCGSGALTLAAIKAGNYQSALGVDISAPLLELAKQRASRTNVDIQFQQSDASAMQLDDKFDLLISRFGVMFFADPIQAFSNLLAHMAPQGRLAFVCWRSLQLNHWAFAPLQSAKPFLKEPPTPPEPGAPGPFSFADEERVLDILSDAGWSNIELKPFDTSIALPGGGPESSAAFMMEIGPLSRLIEEQGLDRTKIENALTEHLTKHVSASGHVEMNAACWIVTASAS